jgi:hypothetical protein
MQYLCKTNFRAFQKNPPGNPENGAMRGQAAGNGRKAAIAFAPKISDP